MVEQKFKLVDLSPEEAEVIKAELQAFLDKHSVHFVVSPLINPNGTLGATMSVLKKEEIKSEGVPSPTEFLPNNGENPTTGSAEQAA